MNAELVAAWCAACCAGAAVWLAHRQDDARRRARSLLAGSGACASPQACVDRCRALGPRARAALAGGLDGARTRLEARFGVRVGPEAGCLPLGIVLALATRSPVPAVAGALVTPYAGRVVRGRTARRVRESRQEGVAGLCASLAGELRAGRPPEAALAEAVERLRGEPPSSAEDRGAAGHGRSGGGHRAGPRRPEAWCDGLTPLLAAARFGGDVPGALRQVATAPGAAGLAGAAACWEVAVDGGAGLADGLDRVAAALRAERDQRDDLRAQLAGPRATAGMLALLPLFGVLLGVSLGADPLRVLLHTPAGLGCLLVGAALEWAGLAWTSRIVRAAEGAS